ncbi:MAG: M23 family metallopeptidase [Bacteroidota bacterium]
MMKLFKWCVLLLFFLPVKSFSQRNTNSVIDTLETKHGPVLLFKNFTWEYFQDEPVMMHPQEDSTGIFSEAWLNDQVFSFKMHPDSIKDTVLILSTTERQFTMPIYGKLFCGFKYTHKGLDIKLSIGDTVKAAFDGVVRYAKYNRGGFGNLIIIRHYNGLETYYAHLSKINVIVNQVIKSGAPIALGGSTGRSRGPHLHFEIRYKDVPLDPLRAIDFDNKKLIASTFPITHRVFYPNDFVENAIYHKIRNGDTIGLLAKKYHTSVKEICAMNKIKGTTKLKIGSSLRVK